jgi:hypothetical protein
MRALRDLTFLDSLNQSELKSETTMATLTEEEFSKHIGTTFHAKLDEREVDLTLTEVKPYMPEPRQGNMERFSLFFAGPPEVFLPQQNFHIRHDGMGEFDIFLVPLRGDEKGYIYEAVFNYFK